MQPIDDRSQLGRRRSVEKLRSQVQLITGSVHQSLGGETYLESALHRIVEVLYQVNLDALQKNIAPIFASKALILDPKGICPPGHSHIHRYKNHSNPVSHHQGLLWLTSCKTFDADLDRDENRESSSEIMQSNNGMARVLR